MSAVNIIAQRDAAHVITDGARYTTDGIVIGISTKCDALPQLPALVASRGPCQALPIILFHLGWKYRTYDALLGGIEGALEEIIDTYSDHFMDGPDIQLYLTGYSDERQKFANFFIHTHDNAAELVSASQQAGADTAGATVPDPFVLTDMPDIAIFPAFPQDQAEAINRGRSTPDELDPIVDGLAILECQRHAKMSGKPGEPPLHWVGGFAMVSTVTRDAVTQRIVHRWTEDEIGEPIRPAVNALAKLAIAPPAPPPAGMSKLQRDMLARKQRKAARR